MIVGSLLLPLPSWFQIGRLPGISTENDEAGDAGDGPGLWCGADPGLALAGVLGVAAEDIRVRDRADREARVAPRLAEC